MQRKLIAAAVTAALGGVAAPAFAINPPAYNPATALDVFWSGATATENQILAYHRIVCKNSADPADRMDIVRATNQFVFFCRTKTNAELTAASAGFSLPASFENRIIAVRKTSVGGSGNGVGPVRTQTTTMPFMNFSSVAANISACTSSLVAAIGPQASYVNWTCPAAFGVSSPSTASNTNTALELARTQGGCSDLEPALFGGSNNLDNITSTNNVVYGVPITRVGYRALQAGQGLVSTDHRDWNCTLDQPWDVTAAQGDHIRGPRSDCERNMPNMTKSAARALFSQNLGSWDQLEPQPSPLPSDPNVYIARRVDSSGTQRSAEVYHFNARCDANVPLMVAANDLGTCGADTVNEGSGSQNVTNCLNTHNGAGRYAVGVLSTEFNTVSCVNVKTALTGTASGTGAFTGTEPACGSASTGTAGEQGNQFRFVKLDGFAPTLVNAANGKYDFQYESSCQTAAVAGAQPGYTGGDTAQAKAWLAFAFPQLNLPDVIQGINQGFRQAFGDSGLLAIPTFSVTPADFPYTTQSLRTRPVGSVTRAPGGTPNSCGFITPIYPVVIGG
jgi:hypothetical protein